MQSDPDGDSRGEDVLKHEQAYITKLLGAEEDGDSGSDTGVSTQEGSGSSGEELEDECKQNKSCPRKTKIDMSSDGGYTSSSDEESCKKNVSFTIDIPLKNEKLYSTEELIEHYCIQNIPLDFKKLIEGATKHIPDSYSVPERPDWVDLKKFKIGQEFAKKYFFGVNYAEMLSLFILFASPDGLQPLIYTGNSSTPFTAFRRYFSTVQRVRSWYEEDVWDKESLGYRNLKTVRALHLNVSKRLNSKSHDELKERLTLWESSSCPAVWSTLKTDIQEDYRSGCPFKPAPQELSREQTGRVFVSQLDMSITQYGFFGLMIMYPEKFGAATATEEELEGFVHLWKCLGYLLGIEDEYNFCEGSFKEVKQRCHYYTDAFVKPFLQNVNEDWEHMSRVMVEGLSFYIPGLTFEASMRYLAYVLDVPAPRVSAAMSWWQSFMYHLTRFTMTVTMWLPGMPAFHSWWVARSLDRTARLSPERLNKLQNKTYDFSQIGKCKTHL